MLPAQPALLLRTTAGRLGLAQGWMLQLPLPELSPVRQSPAKEDRVEPGYQMAKDCVHL